MIEHCTLEEFCRKYCFNEHRNELFAYFKEELHNILCQSEKLRVLVFGSFISEKAKPSDIDILISIIPNRDWAYYMLKKGLRRIHKEKVDVQFNKHQFSLESPESLLETFNTNRLNKKEGIRIEEAVEVIITDL